MVACLENFIGLRGLCSEVADGGLWINDMPDSGIPKLEGLSDVHSADFAGLWAKIYGRATDHFASDIRKIIQPKIKTHDVLRNIRTSVFDQSKPLTQQPYWSGEIITISGSDFMELVINSVQIAFQPASILNTVAVVRIMVYDADTGEELYMKAHSLTAGINTANLNLRIPVNYARNRRVFVGYVNDGVDGYETTSKASGCECNTFCSNSKPFSIEIANTPDNNVPIVYSNFFEDSFARGISVIYGVRCSINNFICQYRDVLAVALRWKAYVELLTEQLWNDSITNKFTLIPRAELEARIISAQNSYNDELTGVLKSITWHADEICWECNEPASIIYHIP